MQFFQMSLCSMKTSKFWWQLWMRLVFQMILLQMYACTSHNAVTTVSNTWIIHVLDANCASWAVLAAAVKATCRAADESYWTVLVQSDRWTLQVSKEPVWSNSPLTGLKHVCTVWKTPGISWPSLSGWGLSWWSSWLQLSWEKPTRCPINAWSYSCFYQIIQ